MRFKPNIHVAILVSLAVLILMAIFVVAPKVGIVPNDGSTEVYGIAIFGLNKNSNNCPTEGFVTY